MTDFMVSTPGRSRLSKALPAPPPNDIPQVEAVTRGKNRPFPTGTRGKMSPFPSPRPLPTPSKVALPRAPVSSNLGRSTPVPQPIVVPENAPTPPISTPLRITIPKIISEMPILIPRRAVGATAIQESRRGSDASMSSIYSSYGRPRSSTGSSYVTKDSSIGSDHDEYLPPPPPKDPRRSQYQLQATPHVKPQESTQTPTEILSEFVSSPASTSPVRPEIWRRRSTKGELNISGLKLTKSNGFTASPTAVNNISPVTKSLPAPPLQLPRSQGVGLPGRNIRKPVPARVAPSQPAPAKVDEMGPNFNRLKEKLQSKKKGKESSDSDKTVPFTNYQELPLENARLPTPEFSQPDRQDLQHTVPTPIGPQTPPETVARQKSPSEDTIKPPLPPSKHGDGNGAKSNSTRLLLPVLNTPGGRVTVPALQLSTPSLPQGSARNNMFPARQASLGNVVTTSSVKESDIETPPLVPAGPIDRTELPVGWKTPLQVMAKMTTSLTNGISISRPLRPSNFKCYNDHLKMKPIRNDIYTVSCQLCDKTDADQRFFCSWCDLLCCKMCQDLLRGDRQRNPNKEVKAVLEIIGRHDKILYSKQTIPEIRTAKNEVIVAREKRPQLYLNEFQPGEGMYEE